MMELPAETPETKAARDAAGDAVALSVAAALSMAAAMIHLWMAPAYFSMWWAYGAFFLAASLAQGLLGASLLRWSSRTVLFSGISLNLALVLAYIAARTAGVPVGPHGGVEGAWLEIAAMAAELGVVAALVPLLDAESRRWMVDFLLVLGAALWILRLTGFLA